jgi:thymidylate synthase (FAD)
MRNKVSLKSYHGGDITHASSAWVSTGGETEAKKGRVPALLKMLAEAGHSSPFEHSQLMFYVTAEYASHIHQIKHRIGVSVNTESARYKEYTSDKWYIPQDWPVRLQAELDEHCAHSFFKYHSVIEELVSKGLDRKRAKESARYFLPLAAQLNFVVTMNFLSFVHFQKLRNSEHAQLEIREIAQAMLEAVRNETDGEFTHSLSAWGL